MKILALLAVPFFVICCQEKTSKQLQPKYGNLPEAFDLLDADGREGAYVIAEDPENQNYVQFGILSGDWIHFDFPSFIDETRDFEPVNNWKIVTDFPDLNGAKRRNFMVPDRAKELWEFLTEHEFNPYYHRAVYEQFSQPIAATESICFNLPRSDREKCLFAVSKAFEIVHGYPAPERMTFTSNQTTWARPAENNSEQYVPAKSDRAGG